MTPANHLHAHARHLSQHTIADCTNTFRKFHAFVDDDPPLTDITADQVRVRDDKQQGAGG